MLSAGEASGDRLGAGLAEALLRRRPELELVGMGGERMERAGVHRLQDSDEVAVVGIVEVLGRLPAIRAAMGRLERELTDRPPDLLVPIDFPDFNLRLAARARRRQVPVVYYVSPQVWAWRRGRVRTIAGLVRRMLVLFPFERSFYEEAGVPVSFVGHPAVETPPPRERSTLCEVVGVDPSRPVVALMPGSRSGELARLLPPMLDAAAALARDRPELQWLVPLASGLDPAIVAAEASRRGLELHVVRDLFPEVLSICEAGVVASGTASLEAALAGLPIVVVYRMSPLSHLLARAMVRLDHIALPNLVADERLVPELVGPDCRPETIAAALARYLDEPEHAASVRVRLLALRERLGGEGAFERAADAVLAELDALRRDS